MKAPLRHRIKEHRRVRAGDLVPHEENPRLHTPQQRRALHALYREIGFARSLLAHELPDGRLKLIDGHLRAALTPEEMLEVEVLDINDEEARKLLLCIDPLAALAGYDDELLTRLRQVAEQDSEAVQTIWQEVQEAEAAPSLSKSSEAEAELRDQFFVLIECQDEEEQVELLRRFQREGLKCQAKLA